MKMYKTTHYGNTIEEVEITRTTNSSVFFMSNGRERREADNHYFATKALAKQSIIDREQRDVDHYERALENAMQDLETAKAIIL